VLRLGGASRGLPFNQGVLLYVPAFALTGIRNQ